MGVSEITGVDIVDKRGVTTELIKQDVKILPRGIYSIQRYTYL